MQMFVKQSGQIAGAYIRASGYDWHGKSFANVTVDILLGPKNDFVLPPDADNDNSTPPVCVADISCFNYNYL
jgi:hypothetical protein